MWIFLDYVKSFKNFNSSNAIDNDDCQKYFSSLKINSPKIYKELENLVSQNYWLDYFDELYIKMKNEYKEDWIDFENEISRVVQWLEYAKKVLDDQFQKGADTAKISGLLWKKIKAVFRTDELAVSFRPNDMKNMVKKLVDDLNKMTRCLEIYLSTYVDCSNCKKICTIENLKPGYVLSFNYTDTYKKLYDQEEHSGIKYDFIHGKADIKNSIDSCNLVLGINEYLSGDEMNKNVDFIQFKKFYQRIYKGTGCNYTDWINDRRTISAMFPKYPPKELNIFIYGHSLDVTDSDILRKLIMQEYSRTTIFYHNKETMGKQIPNLVKIIGEEELIKRTDGNNRTISFKES